MSGRYRAAMAAYVRGHDRIWDLERKRGGADSGDETKVESVEWSGAPESPSFGVGVARSLRFERGPGNARPDDPTGSDGTLSDD